MLVKKLVATGLAIVVTLGLAACDPPLPPEILAAQAEKTVTCIDGNIALSAPAKISDVIDSWSTSLTGACTGMSITKVAEDKAQAVITLGTPVAPKCTPFATLPIAEDAGVLAYSLADAPNLVLTAQNVQDIFSGKVTTWNDPTIAAANPDATLPSEPIKVVGTPQQSEIDALTSWFKTLGVTFTPSLAKVTPIDAGVGLDKIAEGEIAITSFSNALIAYSTVASIAVGKNLATADAAGVQLGADKTAAKPKEGDPIGYGATYPVMLALCGADNNVARALGRFFVRQDSQGALGSAVIAALPDSERVKSISIVEKGLPKPKK